MIFFSSVFSFYVLASEGLTTRIFDPVQDEKNHFQWPRSFYSFSAPRLHFWKLKRGKFWPKNSFVWKEKKWVMRTTDTENSEKPILTDLFICLCLCSGHVFGNYVISILLCTRTPRGKKIVRVWVRKIMGCTKNIFWTVRMGNKINDCFTECFFMRYSLRKSRYFVINSGKYHSSKTRKSTTLQFC